MPRKGKGELLVLGLGLAPLEVFGAQLGVGGIGLVQGVALGQLQAGEALLHLVFDAKGHQGLDLGGRDDHHPVLVPQEHVAGQHRGVADAHGLLVVGRCQKILEIGTFVGFGTLHLLSAAGDTARVTTIEKFDHFAEIARENFVTNNAGDRIELLCGDALEIIPELKGKTFDFIYLDGDKGNYDQYFPLLDTILEKGGMLVADDCFFHGDVFNEHPSTEKGAGVKRFLDAVSSNNNYHKILFPLFNGMLVLVKK